MSFSIHALSSDCLSIGKSLVEETKAGRYDIRTYEVSRHDWERVLFKFDTWIIEWGADIDDHDPASLASKVQDREHVAQALISLLVYLKETLKAAERCVERGQDQVEMDKMVESLKYEREAAETRRRIYEEGYVRVRTELQCLCATVKAIMGCLDTMALLALPRERLVDKHLLHLAMSALEARGVQMNKQFDWW